MEDRPPLTEAEVFRVLRRLQPITDGRRLVLIGGQAVAFWSAYFQLQPGENQELFTSEDVDFAGSTDTVTEAAHLLDGHAHLPHRFDPSPSSGLVTWTDTQGVPREIDFLAAPVGLDFEDLFDTAIRVEFPDPEGKSGPAALWVLHPERCLESRVKNWMLLRQRGRIARNQLVRSITCAHRFSAEILTEEAVEKPVRIRAVLRLNERLFDRCFRDQEFLGLYRETGMIPSKRS
ncbi:MAG: hypothetical protein M9938_04235 [Solirubrobacterales bacterium]|nr:hypothetical protein [Solirubrobacterales bacterium]